ncbi:unnamed protein product [Camellia sinensis]
MIVVGWWVLFLILLLLISYSLHPLLHFSPPNFWVLGLFLPCPSNGLFGNANSNYCLKRQLIDCPIETVSSVQLSVNTKFPFDSIDPKNPDCQLNLKLIKDQNNCVDGFVEMEGEASCSSISGARKLQNVVERDLILRNELVRRFDVVNSSVHVKKGGFDLKGKGIVNQRPRNGLRRRRKGLADYAKVLPVSYDPSYANDQSHFSIDREGNNEIDAVHCQSALELMLITLIAMAIIPRLQDEKASIEMEAWIVGSSLTKDIIIECSSLDHFLGFQELLQQADKSLLLSTGICNTSSTIDTVVNSFFSSGGLLLNKARDWLFHDWSSNGENELYKEGRVSEFMDRKLIPSAVLDQVQLCVHIRIMCAEYDPELRPTMGCVYSMLSENHSNSSALFEEPMRDGSSSASYIARNSGPTKLANNGSSSRVDIHLENEGLPKHRGLTCARRIQPEDVQSYIPSIPSSSCSSIDGPVVCVWVGPRSPSECLPQMMIYW